MIELIHGEYYWVKVGNEITVGQYIHDAWSRPRFYVIGTDESVFESEWTVLQKINSYKEDKND